MITLFFSIPINIYLYFIGKLVQQIAVLAFGIVILDSFLLLYCRIDWELTRHFVWVIEEINGVVIFHLVCSYTMELHPERMMGLEMLLFTGSTNHTLKSQFFSTFIVFSPCSFGQCLQVDTQIPQWINELSVIPYKNILNNFTLRHEKQTILRQGRPVNLLEYLKRIFLNIWKEELISC